jgi:hypothetical protein
MWHYFDSYLQAFYRITGVESLDGMIGTFLLALATVVIGEFTISIVFRVNRSHLERLNDDLKKYGDLSQEALRLGDETSYKALNKQANDAYGHVFFNKFGRGRPLAGFFRARLDAVPFRGDRNRRSNLPFRRQLCGRFPGLLCPGAHHFRPAEKASALFREPVPDAPVLRQGGFRAIGIVF